MINTDTYVKDLLENIIGLPDFYVAAAVICNSLPTRRLHSASISRVQFSDGWKTHLFSHAYTWLLWEHDILRSLVKLPAVFYEFCGLSCKYNICNPYCSVAISRDQFGHFLLVRLDFNVHCIIIVISCVCVYVVLLVFSRCFWCVLPAALA